MYRIKKRIATCLTVALVIASFSVNIDDKNIDKPAMAMETGTAFLQDVASGISGAVVSSEFDRLIEQAEDEDASLHIIDGDEKGTIYNGDPASSNGKKSARSSATQTDEAGTKAGYEGMPWASERGLEVQWYLQDIGCLDSWTKIEYAGRHPGQDIVVAVVDTGIETTHKDLKNQLWTNTVEKNGTPGVDDDNNGYVDDIYGPNIVDPSAPMSDTHGHGTQMAGIIAMEAGNGGGVGVAYGAKVMPVRVAVKEEFSIADAIRGLQYAVTHEADIISMSFATDVKSDALSSAIALAANRCVLVAAAGNENSNTNNPSYPAAYAGVTGVMAHDTTGTLTSFTNWDIDPGSGVEYEISAPGKDIVCPSIGGKYYYEDGTSHATAVVSGAMAVALSELHVVGKYPGPAAFKNYFLSNMKHTTSPDALHMNQVYRKLSLSDVILNETVSLVFVTPTDTPAATATPMLTPTPAPTAATPSPSELPQATVEPVATSSPALIEPTEDPDDGITRFKKGDIVETGKDAKKAYYIIKNIKKRTVYYYKCNTKGSVKKAKIPKTISLPDGKKYTVTGIRKKSFTKSKKIKKVVVYSPHITKAMMKKAIRGSNVKTVVYK